MICAACRGGESKPKKKVYEDAAVPVDALRVSGEADRDKLFLSVPTAKAVEGVIERLSTKPHLAGTKPNEEVAKEIMRTLGRMGWKLGTVQYDVYLPHPKKLSITVGGAAIAVTEPSAAKFGAGPELLAWNAYSASGTAKAPIVYASHGLPEDFAALKKAGVDPKGKILLLRYGALYPPRTIRIARAIPCSAAPSPTTGSTRAIP
jgi:N-acetylated-alpha-linked acidic dipeptidase